MSQLMIYFEEYLGYLSAEKNVSKYTLDNYTSDFKIFTQFLLFKNLPLDISTQHLKKQIEKSPFK